MSVTRIGVWAGYGIFGSSRARYMETIRRVGLTDVCVVINDGFKVSKGKTTVIRDFVSGLRAKPEAITSVCTDLRKAGATPHLMSWAVGDLGHTATACLKLPKLAKDAGVESVQLDAEEPWIKGGDQVKLSGYYADMGETLKAGGIELGVNAIVFTEWKAVEPLTILADYVVPQAYSSSNKPTVMQLGHDAYRTRGPGRVDMGLKGYDQTILSLEAGRRATERLTDPVVGRVWYWSLYQICQSAPVQRFLTSWCKEVRDA